MDSNTTKSKPSDDEETLWVIFAAAALTGGTDTFAEAKALNATTIADRMVMAFKERFLDPEQST